VCHQGALVLSIVPEVYRAVEQRVGLLIGKSSLSVRQTEDHLDYVALINRHLKPGEMLNTERGWLDGGLGYSTRVPIQNRVSIISIFMLRLCVRIR
jgi:hypothetical protein